MIYVLYNCWFDSPDVHGYIKNYRLYGNDDIGYVTTFSDEELDELKRTTKLSTRDFFITLSTKEDYEWNQIK